MPIDEYDTLRNKLTAAYGEVGALTEKLLQAERADPVEKLALLLDGIQAAIPVVQYAAANLDPRVTTRWPHAALERFAVVLSSAPGLSHDARELALELHTVAVEAKALEQDRILAGLYSGPDPLDLNLLQHIAARTHFRIETLRDAGYLTVEITPDGIEALEETGRGVISHDESNVANATETA